VGDGEASNSNDTDDETDDNANDVSGTDDDGDIGESVPGFGIGGTLTGIGGAVYLLKRRLTDNCR